MEKLGNGQAGKHMGKKGEEIETGLREKTIGELVKRWGAERGISLGRIAELAGLPPTTVVGLTASVGAGKCGTIAAIGQALGVKSGALGREVCDIVGVQKRQRTPGTTVGGRPVGGGERRGRPRKRGADVHPATRLMQDRLDEFESLAVASQWLGVSVSSLSAIYTGVRSGEDCFLPTFARVVAGSSGSMEEVGELLYKFWPVGKEYKEKVGQEWTFVDWEKDVRRLAAVVKLGEPDREKMIASWQGSESAAAFIAAWAENVRG